MAVRRISARYNPKTRRAAITFEVEAQTWRNMCRSADEGAHFGTLDYIAAVINTAFLDDTPVADAPPPAEGRDDNDLDDDIPF